MQTIQGIIKIKALRYGAPGLILYNFVENILITCTTNLNFPVSICVSSIASSMFTKLIKGLDSKLESQILYISNFGHIDTFSWREIKVNQSKLEM